MKHSILLSFAPIIMIGCGMEKPERVNQRSLPEKFIPGSFLVEVNSDDEAQHATALRETAAKAAAAHGCEASEPARVKWETESGTLSKRLANTYHVQFKNCDLDEVKTTELLDAMAASSVVTNVQANATLEAVAAVVENDPDRNKQYYLGKVNRNEACEALPQQNKRTVVVAVIDSGVDMDHPDLVKNFYRDSSGNIVGANFVGKGESSPPDGNWDDGNGHGTHVAGLVAAASNNSQGIVGVAGCANVKIMPIRALNDQGSGNNLEIERAVQWAAKKGADIINMSLGGARTFQEKPTSFSSALYDALAKEGVVVFAASGNDGAINGARNTRGYVYHFPSSYDNVIGVASTDETGALSSFSNRGALVDIAAPGSNMYATFPGGTYKSLSGTSMASPVAAGTYALALSSVIDRAARRIHHDDAIAMFSKAVRAEEPAINNRLVATAGVVDSKVLMSQMMTAMGQVPVDEAPVDSAPQTPVDVQPAPMGFSFVDLEANERLSGAQTFGIHGLPQGARYVYLYWGKGTRLTSFTRLTANGSAVESDEPWYLLGQGTLYAEAIDAYGRRLGVISLPLQGLNR